MKTIILIDDNPESRRTTSDWMTANGHNVIAAIDAKDALRKLRSQIPQPVNDNGPEEANRTKSEFLANMSHELRSPLNAMLLLAEDLARNSGNLTKDQRESIHIIGKAGQSLLFLINDILELSKLESGRPHVNVREIRLRHLADYIQSLFGHMADNKGLHFTIALEKSLPETIWTDHQKIEQILNNLISNAVKFTSQGKIAVRFFRPASGPGDFPIGCAPSEMIAIEVSDTGIGIPEDKQETVFEAFQQADSGTSRKFGGTGLGLSISKKLAGLLGGTIHLESRENQGSLFTVYLPIDKMKTTEATSGVHEENPCWLEQEHLFSSQR